MAGYLHDLSRIATVTIPIPEEATRMFERRREGREHSDLERCSHFPSVQLGILQRSLPLVEHEASSTVHVRAAFTIHVRRPYLSINVFYLLNSHAQASTHWTTFHVQATSTQSIRCVHNADWTFAQLARTINFNISIMLY